MEEEYIIKLPVTDALFMDDDLTFSIQHIRSREVSTLYFTIDFYDMHDNHLYTYTSDRWVIDTVYSSRYKEFRIPSDVFDDIARYQITMYAQNITSENPLYFNGLMLNEGDYDEYHKSNEEVSDALIKFNKTSYTNLYGHNGVYLQVIRPSKTDMHTNKLDKCDCTILAPHLAEESEFDDPIAIFLEYINMTEQRIDVLR